MSVCAVLLAGRLEGPCETCYQVRPRSATRLIPALPPGLFTLTTAMSSGLWLGFGSVCMTSSPSWLLERRLHFDDRKPSGVGPHGHAETAEAHAHMRTRNTGADGQRGFAILAKRSPPIRIALSLLSLTASRCAAQCYGVLSQSLLCACGTRSKQVRVVQGCDQIGCRPTIGCWKLHGAAVMSLTP